MNATRSQLPRSLAAMALLLAGCAGPLPGPPPEPSPPAAEGAVAELVACASDRVTLRFSTAKNPQLQMLEAAIALPRACTPEVRLVTATLFDLPPGAMPTLDELSELLQPPRLKLSRIGELRGIALWKIGVAVHAWPLPERLARDATAEQRACRLTTLTATVSWPAPDEAVVSPQDNAGDRVFEQILERASLNFGSAPPAAVADWRPDVAPRADWLPLPDAERVLASTGPYPCLRLDAVEEAVYAVSTEDLAGAGFDPAAIRPETIRLFRDGAEVPLFLHPAASPVLAPGDRILFANPKDNPDSRTPNVYWMTWGGEAGLRYRTLPAPAPVDATHRIQARWDLRYLRLLPQDKEDWAWARLSSGEPTSFDFSLPGAIPDPRLRYRIDFRGSLKRGETNPGVELKLNGSPVAFTLTLEPPDLTLSLEVPGSALKPGANRLDVRVPVHPDRPLLANLTTLAATGERILACERGQLVFHARQWIPDATPADLESACWPADEPVLTLDPATVCLWLREPRAANPAATLPAWAPAPFEACQGEQVRALTLAGREIDLPQAPPLVLVRLAASRTEPASIEGFFETGEAADVVDVVLCLGSLRAGEVLIGFANPRAAAFLDGEAHAWFARLGVPEFAARDNEPSVCIARRGALGGNGLASSAAPLARLAKGPWGESTAALPPLAATPDVLYQACPSGLRAPEQLVPLARPLLRQPDHEADLIVIAPEAFFEALEPLVDHRRAEGYRVAVVDVQNVFNEWSGGVVTPDALRRFLRHACASWRRPAPQYVLFVGECNEDTFDQQRYGTPNHVPMPRVPGRDYASDDGLVAFSQDQGLPELVSGRFPARTADDVRALVRKTLAYESDPEPGPWRNRALLVFDYEMEQYHQDLRRHLPAWVRPRLYFAANAPKEDFYLLQQVGNLRAKTSPDVPRDLVRLISEGDLLIHYIGHGGGIVWGRTGLLRVTDRPGTDSDQFGNGRRMPLVHSLSCLAGLPDHSSPIGRVSLSEWFALRPEGGAVGSLGPSGKSWGGTLARFVGYVNEHLFLPGGVRAGAAYTYAKLAMCVEQNRLSALDDYTFFGDPLLRFEAPPRIVDVTVDCDPSRGLARVTGTVHGHRDGLVELALHTEDETVPWEADQVPVRRGRFETDLPLEVLRGHRLRGLYATYWDPDGPAIGGGFCPVQALPVETDVLDASAHPVIAAVRFPPQTIFPGCSVQVSLTLDNPTDATQTQLRLSAQRPATAKGTPWCRLEGFLPTLMPAGFDLLPGERREAEFLFEFADKEGLADAQLRLTQGTEVLDATWIQFRVRGYPDLALVREDIEVVSLFNPGYRRVLVRGAVRNLGESDAMHVKLRFSENGEALRPVLWLDRVAAGGKAPFSQLLVVGGLAPRIEFEVDPFREIMEPSKENNRLTVKIDSMTNRF